MRVATRRSRAVIAATQAVFRPKRIAPLAKDLKRLARALGVVRDGDVILEHLHHYADPLDEADRRTFGTLMDEVQHDRDAGHRALHTEMGSKRYLHLLRDLDEFLLAPLNDLLAPDNGLPILVRHQAGSAILARYEAVRRYETVLPTATTEQLHDLRIVCKHLRYTLELFAAPLAAHADGLLKPVKAAQEVLGTIHDADVATDLVAPWQGTADDVFARYAAARHHERTTAVADLTPLWAKLTTETYRKSLGRAIASL